MFGFFIRGQYTRQNLFVSKVIPKTALHYMYSYYHQHLNLQGAPVHFKQTYSYHYKKLSKFI